MTTNEKTGLAHFTAALREHATRFAPPAQPGEVTALVTSLGLAVPPEFHALYALCDGSARDQSWSKHPLTEEDGFALLSVAEVADHKRFWDGLAREYLTQSEDERRDHYHYGFWNPAWIPIGSGLDEVYALATEPCFGGPPHQLVAFNYKGDTSWFVVAESLDAFLERIAMLLVESAPRFGMSTCREIGLVPGELAQERFDRTDVPRPPERVTARSLIERAAAEQRVDAQQLRERVLAAVATAANEVFGPTRVVEAQLDADDVDLFAVIDVVAEVATPGREVAHADVHELGFELGDQMLVQLFYLVGDEDKAAEQDRSMAAALARDANLNRATAAWRERYLQVVADVLERS